MRIFRSSGPHEAIAAAARKAGGDDTSGIRVFAAVVPVRADGGVDEALAECIANVETAGWELDAMSAVSGTAPLVLMVFRRTAGSSG